MSKKRQTLTDWLNNFTYRTIYNRFQLIATSAFTWEGLPPGMEERHIEKLLFEHGKAAFFEDKDMTYLCLRADESGEVNVYGDHLYYTATGFNYSRRLNADDFVLIENNLLRLSTLDFVMFYTYKLAEIERTMDVNVKSVKTPTVFTCDDKDVLTWKRIFQQVDGNVPAVFADKNLNVDGIKALSTGAKFLGNELTDYKRSVENELLTLLGLNNLPTDKKERLITDEANSNNQLIQSFIDLQLDARIKAAEAINMKYGLSVSCKKRTDLVVDKPVEKEENENAAG